MVFKSVGEFLTKFEKTDKLPNIILVYSNVHDSIQQIFVAAAEKLKKTFSQVDSISLNGTEIDSGVFHSEMSTIPMFDMGRLILIRHADAVLKKIDSNKTVLAYFIRDFNNIYDKTLLIIQCEGKLPASLSALSEKAWTIEEEKTRPRDIPDIIKTRAHKMGFEIEDGAIQEMAGRYSLNPGLLVSALDRLFLYCLDEKKINRDDIREVSINIEGDLVFDIIDAVAARDTNKAVKLFQNNEFTNGVFFAGSINKFFTDFMRYLYLKNNGMGIKEIHERLELNTRHSFIFRKNEERFNMALKKYSMGEVSEILEKLFELDRAMKENNGIDIQKNLLTMFIISLEYKDR
ncbi:MAG: DNA polymerase III subunit delta [Spirochaetia bacterium]|nr:DNA polymerase III subunit delta [Spirochaetia bacterium]